MALTELPDEVRHHTLRGTEIAIPALIKSLAIKMQKGFRVRAVVVTEHRNLDFASKEIRSHTSDILFVQVYVQDPYLH